MLIVPPLHMALASCQSGLIVGFFTKLPLSHIILVVGLDWELSCSISDCESQRLSIQVPSYSESRHNDYIRGQNEDKNGTLF